VSNNGHQQHAARHRCGFAVISLNRLKTPDAPIQRKGIERGSATHLPVDSTAMK